MTALAAPEFTWRHVVRPANLLSAAGGGQTSEVAPSTFPERPACTDIAVHSCISRDVIAPYMSSQVDSRAAECRHQYALDVASRIDLAEGESEDSTVPQDDFVAIVTITSAADPAESGNVGAARVPWGSVVVTTDRLRQYPVTLYATDLPRFTGIFPGAVVGVRGTVLKRDTSTMRPKDVALNRIVLPKLPVRQLVAATDATPRSLRVHFAAGPYGRDATALQSAVAKLMDLAVQRRAQLSFICGPFAPVPAVGDHLAVDRLPTDLELFAMNKQALTFAAAHPSTRFVLVPAVNDITCVPVMPQVPPYALGESPVTEYSNPCEATAAGLTIGVCSYDAFSLLKGVQLERGVPPEARLRQLCHSLVRSGVYVPVVDSGDRVTDVTMLNRMAFGYAAAQDNSAQQQLPQVVFYPNVSYTTPFAVPAGGPNGTLVVSCSNREGQQGFTVLELTITDTARATREGCVPEVCHVGTIEVVSN
jgi:hypothetical protein